MSLIKGIADIIGAGVGIYTAYQSQKATSEASRAARRQAIAAEKEARIARESAIELSKTRIADAERNAAFIAGQLGAAQEQTALMQQQAEQARAASQLSISEQKRASALALQQQQLAADIQQQQQATTGVVGSRVRKRVGTPAAMRTSLEIQSPLSGGVGMGTPNATGGLNV